MRHLFAFEIDMVSGGLNQRATENWGEPSLAFLPDPVPINGEVDEVNPDYEYDIDIDRVPIDRTEGPVPGDDNYERDWERNANRDLGNGLWYDLIEQGDGSWRAVLVDTAPSLDAANYSVVYQQIGWFSDLQFVVDFSEALTALGISLPTLQFDLVGILRSLDGMSPAQMAEYINANQATLSPVLVENQRALDEFIARYGYNPLDQDNGDDEGSGDEGDEPSEGASYDDDNDYEDDPSGTVTIEPYEDDPSGTVTIELEDEFEFEQ